MKKRILVYFVSVLTAAIAVTTAVTALLTYSMFQERVIQDLEVDARVLEKLAASAQTEQDFDSLGDKLRVTIIEADGTVICDNRADAEKMDDHGDRPEIVQALEEGEGRDIRQSETVDRSTFYYAMRMEDGRVLRVAKEASSIWNVYLRAAPLILLVTLLMIALCTGVANLLTRKLVEPIARMTERLEDTSVSSEYPEMTPFLSTIRNQHAEILKSANMRVEFTANVSHELKTPLTSISGYAELIESGMASGEMAQRFAGEIHKSANRLLTLINDIIELSQMDSPERAIEREPVELAQVAAGVIEQLKLSAEKMDVQFKLELQEAQVFADKRLMEELVHNLCDNAIRYNVRGGSVRVQVHPVRDRVLLVVQDTGIGISKENQKHVFERFYRVDKSRSKATGGTGLGLAIVKHIAAKHDAKLSMESELGRGTTITVSFERML